MNKNNLRIILAMLPIIVTIGSIGILLASAFADTVKCKNNGDNNCNNNDCSENNNQ